MKRFIFFAIFFIPVFCFSSGIRGTKWGMPPSEIISQEKKAGNTKYDFRKTRFRSYFLTFKIGKTEEGLESIIYIFNQNQKLKNIVYIFQMHPEGFNLPAAIRVAESILKKKLLKYHVGWHAGNTGVGFFDNEKDRIWKIDFWAMDKNLLE